MIFLVLIALMTPVAVVAVPADSSSVETIKEELQTNINIVWTCIAAFLVFFMQAGFAMVEAGFTLRKKRSKHTDEESDGLFRRHDRLLFDRIRPDVRQNERTVRDYIVWP